MSVLAHPHTHPPTPISPEKANTNTRSPQPPTFSATDPFWSSSNYCIPRCWSRCPLIFVSVVRNEFSLSTHSTVCQSKAGLCSKPLSLSMASTLALSIMPLENDKPQHQLSGYLHFDPTSQQFSINSNPPPPSTHMDFSQSHVPDMTLPSTMPLHLPLKIPQYSPAGNPSPHSANTWFTIPSPAASSPSVSASPPFSAALNPIDSPYLSHMASNTSLRPIVMPAPGMIQSRRVSTNQLHIDSPISPSPHTMKKFRSMSLASPLIHSPHTPFASPSHHVELSLPSPTVGMQFMPGTAPNYPPQQVRTRHSSGPTTMTGNFGTASFPTHLATPGMNTLGAAGLLPATPILASSPHTGMMAFPGQMSSTDMSLNVLPPVSSPHFVSPPMLPNVVPQTSPAMISFGPNTTPPHHGNGVLPQQLGGTIVHEQQQHLQRPSLPVSTYMNVSGMYSPGVTGVRLVTSPVEGPSILPTPPSTWTVTSSYFPAPVPSNAAPHNPSSSFMHVKLEDIEAHNESAVSDSISLAAGSSAIAGGSAPPIFPESEFKADVGGFSSTSAHSAGTSSPSLSNDSDDLEDFEDDDEADGTYGDSSSASPSFPAHRVTRRARARRSSPREQDHQHQDGASEVQVTTDDMRLDAKFATRQDAIDYLKEEAKRCGFTVLVRTSRADYVVVICNCGRRVKPVKQGAKRQRNRKRKTAMTGCQWHVILYRKSGGSNDSSGRLWEIKPSTQSSHNHPLSPPSPAGSSSMMQLAASSDD
ncbi:hypothetical protein BJ742DRAFT_91307 [Cladochytrium replicatum]|nr:hypothetical protein BJ742DRAFT_91307 [Cladochytrium replicatum]